MSMKVCITHLVVDDTSEHQQRCLGIHPQVRDGPNPSQSYAVRPAHRTLRTTEAGHVYDQVGSRAFRAVVVTRDSFGGNDCLFRFLAVGPSLRVIYRFDTEIPYHKDILHRIQIHARVREKRCFFIPSSSWADFRTPRGIRQPVLCELLFGDTFARSD